MRNLTWIIANIVVWIWVFTGIFYYVPRGWAFIPFIATIAGFAVLNFCLGIKAKSL